MKLLHVGTTGWMLSLALLAACGGGGSGAGGGAGGGGGGKTCSSNAQCGAGEECVLSTTSAPMDFEDDDGFGGDDSFGGSGGDDSFGGSGGDDSFGGSSGDGAGGTDPGSGGSGQPSGTCKPTGGSGGSGAEGSGGSGAGGSGGGSSCSSDFITGSTFYKGSVAFGECDDAGHPQNCQFGYFIKTNDGCVCTAPCNSGNLPKIGEACSTDGSWTCQTLQNSNGTYDLCTHSGLNLCTAG